MPFKYDENNIDTSLELKNLIEAELLPDNIPEQVKYLRNVLIKEKGYSTTEQTMWQKYQYQLANNLIDKNKDVATTPETVETPDDSTKPIAISVKNVTKIYDLDLKKRGADHIKKRFYALRNVSFDVKQGEVMGIFGTNGSGKTTVSQLIAGMTDYDEGTITVNGVQALIPARVGLKNEITGEENIEYKAALMGLRRSEVEKVKKDVIDYAELGDHMYVPVKKYSSGMRSRLGFAISLALHPDIYILDEVLSVGDVAFKQKCFDTMNQLRDEDGKTVLFISHSIEEIKKFCTSTVWIESGQLIECGPVETVAEHYRLYTNYLAELSKKTKEAYLKELSDIREEPIPTFKEKVKALLHK
jgi:teichoic acid transport system ATP-binding protein